MKNRSKRELIEGVQNVLESHRRFTMETISYGDKWIMPDEKFKYRQPWYSRVETGFWRCILATLGPLLLKVAFGVRVTGKENLALVKDKGAITLCNHIHYLDTLFIRQAIGHINSFHTMAPWNNKKGLGGHIIRHGGTWPLSRNITAMRNFQDEMKRRLEQGKKVNFYPEQAMWWNYRKPRPMKDGAFHYAVKFDVPVLPVFCTFDKTKRGGIKKLVIHILPPIYPDKSELPRYRVSSMRRAAELSWRQCYEEAYGIPLEYLPDLRSQKQKTLDKDII